MKKCRSKRVKGQNYYLIGLVIMSLFLLVSFPLYSAVKSKSNSVLSHQACADSVRLNSGLKLSEGEYANAIKCPTVCENRKEKNKDDALKLLSNRMVMTWKEFNRGQPNLFKDDLFEKNSYCIVRFIETFDNADKIGTISGKEFADYLWSDRVTYDKKEMPVMEFLSAHDSNELDTINLADFQAVPINTAIPQAVVVLYTKKTELNSVFAKLAGGSGAVLGVSGVIVGALATVGSGGIVLLGVAGLAAGGAAGGALAIKSRLGISSNHDAAIMILPWQSDVLAKLNCEYMPADPGDTEVC